MLHHFGEILHLFSSKALWYYYCESFAKNFMTLNKEKMWVSLLLLVATLFLVQCKKENKIQDTINDVLNGNTLSDSASIAKKDSASLDQVHQKANFKYTALIFPEKKRDSVMTAFKKQFSEQEIYTILALNRLDKKNSWRADTLMIPDKISENFLDYSPFPYQLDVLSDVKKLVIFSYPIQAYAVYENGKLLKWGPSSMGKKAAQTKRGLMFANWKKELAISTVDSEWKLPYNFNIHNTLGIGWHQYDLPGFPASHSCLRLLMDDAKWMYNFADQWILNKGGATTKAKGTPVIVFGDYAWGKKKPWKQLYLDPKATDYSVEQMIAIIEPHKAEILKEQQNRDQVLASMPAKQEPPKKDSL